MSWHDFYRRQSAIQAVLDHATAHPSDELALEAVPQASEVFATTGELLRALHYKWTQLLTGRIGIALADADADPRVDRVQAVTTAWRRTAAGNPDLRAVLDRHAGARRCARPWSANSGCWPWPPVSPSTPSQTRRSPASAPRS
ncbi:hypothetical protein ACFQ0O_06635 [Saccharopolyspora spinosporotrichia]